MRWKERNTKPDFSNRTRTITKFLFFPKKINGEWRWLEIATYKQKYMYSSDAGWIDWEWIDG